MVLDHNGDIYTYMEFLDKRINEVHPNIDGTHQMMRKLEHMTSCLENTPDIPG